MARYTSVQMYTARWCGDCRRAKMWLDEHDIPYTSVDISLEENAGELLERQTGKRGIPYLVLDGEWIRGYTPGRGVDFSLYRELFRDYPGVA